MEASRYGGGVDNAYGGLGLLLMLLVVRDVGGEGGSDDCFCWWCRWRW